MGTDVSPSALLRCWKGYSFPALSKAICQQLAAADKETAEQETRLLLCFIFGEDVWQLVLDPAAQPPQNQLHKLAELLARRLSGEPLSHVLGEKGFWSLDLLVNKNVLTPRADTERLVAAALEQTKAQSAGRVLDLGTGSGAILLAFLAERPNWQGIGVDKSLAALDVAKTNAAQCNLAGRCTFMHTDWADLSIAPVDLVLSNPPYIASKELAHLDVAKFEPVLALDGGDDGLAAYRVLAKHLSSWLQPGGQFAFEIGHTQAKDVHQIIYEHTNAHHLQTKKDFGQRDRVVMGCMQECHT